MFLYLIYLLLLFPLLPIVLYQAIRVKKTVPKIAEAEKLDSITKNSKHNILLLGESAFAGVGVKSNLQGISGKFAKYLKSYSKKKVSWQLFAKNGYTVNDINDKILTRLEAGIKLKKVSLIVIGIGGNDAFQMNAPLVFTKNIKAMITILQNEFSGIPIVFANMPPVYEFPAFTRLMQFFLGGMVKLYRKELIKISNKFEGVYFYADRIHFATWQAKAPEGTKIEELFSDGVHPSALAYQIWAKELFEFSKQRLKLK